MYDDYLIHYGVIGMKWGVKRATRLTKKSVKAKKKASKAGESLEESRRILKVEGKKHNIAAREKDLMSSRQRVYAHEKAESARKAQRIVNDKRAKAEKYSDRGTGFRSWNNDRKANKAQKVANKSKTEASKAFRKANMLKAEADKHRAEIGGMKNDVTYYKDLQRSYLEKAKKYADKSKKIQDKYGVIVETSQTKRGKTKVKAYLK